MNWLITGGCGFIGTRLIETLLAQAGESVRVLDDLSVGTRESLGAIAPVVETGRNAVGAMLDARQRETIELIVGDIRDRELVNLAATGAEVVVHLAANAGVVQSVEDPLADCETNVLGTLSVLDAARENHVRRFVFASSGAPAGEVTPPIHEELAPHPVSPYGASKLAGEGYCSAYSHSFGLETVVLRFGNVYGTGSGHKGSVVAKFIREAMRGDTLTVYGDGSHTRDFIFTDDLVRAIFAAATVPGVGGETFQIATSQETTLRELLDQLLPALESCGVRDVDVAFGEPRVGDVLRNYADTSKAKAQLGWQAEVPLAEGLARTVAWFVDRGADGGRAKLVAGATR